MKSTKPSKSNFIALAGEHAVLSALAQRQIVAAPTQGHTKEVDIVAVNRDTGRGFEVEVKTTAAEHPTTSALFGPHYSWMMSKKHGDIEPPTLVYCFVRLEPGGGRQFYLVPSADVAEYVRWEHAHWLASPPSRRRTEKAHTAPMRLFRIPTTPTPAPETIPPSWRDGRYLTWEDNWSIFGDPKVAQEAA